MRLFDLPVSEIRQFARETLDEAKLGAGAPLLPRPGPADPAKLELHAHPSRSASVRKGNPTCRPRNPSRSRVSSGGKKRKMAPKCFPFNSAQVCAV